MASTKIWQITKTTGKALQYIMDPEKTDGGLLVSGFNTEPEMASLEFEMTMFLSKSERGDYSRVGGADIKAHHMIQNFSPDDNITPEQAHEIGRAWANEVLGGKHEYVIATHIDKGHIHNHVIFNATSYFNLKKFKSVPKKTVQRLRQISDRLCEENGLIVLPENLPKNKEHTNWNVKPSKRTGLQGILDEAIQEAVDFDSFKKELETRGVKIKEGKHLAYLPPDGKRFLRGHNIKGDYSKEKILQRIEENKLLPPKEKNYADKIEQLAKTVTIQDVQELADTLSTIRRERIEYYAGFSEKESSLNVLIEDLEKENAKLEKKHFQFNQIAKYLVTYHETKKTYDEYKNMKSFFKDGFRKREQRKIEMHEYAGQQLEKSKINPAIDSEKVLELANEQTIQVQKNSERVVQIKKRTESILKAEKVVQQIYRKVQAKETQSDRKVGMEL